MRKHIQILVGSLLPGNNLLAIFIWSQSKHDQNRDLNALYGKAGELLFTPTHEVPYILSIPLFLFLDSSTRNLIYHKSGLLSVLGEKAHMVQTNQFRKESYKLESGGTV